MDQNPRPFMGLLSAVAVNDFHKLIQSRSLAQWKETIAMLVAYVEDRESWCALCDTLGVRLYQAGNIHAASICFICSGNVEKAVGVWSSQGTGSLAGMQEIIKRAFVLGAAVPSQSSSQSLCTIVHNYAQVLAAQGSVQTALEYLDMLPGEATEDVQILRDRIYGSGLANPSGMGAPSPAPDQGYGAHDYTDQWQTAYQESYDTYDNSYPPPQQPPFQPPPVQSSFQPAVQSFQPPPVQQQFQPSAAQTFQPPVQQSFQPAAPPFQPSFDPTALAFQPSPLQPQFQPAASPSYPPGQSPNAFVPSVISLVRKFYYIRLMAQAHPQTASSPPIAQPAFNPSGGPPVAQIQPIQDLSRRPFVSMANTSMPQPGQTLFNPSAQIPSEHHSKFVTL